MLRNINLSAIMNWIRIEAPISRSTLARKTGLNKATITSLVGELISRDLICEVGLETNALGRPSMNLMLNPDAGYIIGTEIGVDFINIIATDFSPKVVFSKFEQTSLEMSIDHVFQRLVSGVQEAITMCQQKVGGNFFGIALGVPGLVDYQSGTLLFAPNLKWRDVDLKKRLSEHFSCPVIVDNEANLATFGEYYFGSAYQHPDVLFLSAGIGLGGGILHNEELFRGVNGMGGELGHITIIPDGELCGCGNRGCWETLVSLRALYRYVEEQRLSNKDSVLFQHSNGKQAELTIENIVAAANEGDRVALVALAKVGRYLGIGIASLINSLNPSMVVFGGIMSSAWKFLEPVITSEISTRALLWNRLNTEVVLAKYGSDACVMGGIALIYQATISHSANG